MVVLTGEPLFTMSEVLLACGVFLVMGQVGILLGEWVTNRKDDSLRIFDDMTYDARCPACGDVIDYCRGHGEIGDLSGFLALQAHDNDDHSQCSPMGCDDAPAFGPGYVRDRNKTS